MSTHQAGQILRLELQAQSQARLIAQLLGRLVDLEQQARVSQTGGMADGGGGGGFRVGVALATIGAGSNGTVQPCTTPGWTPDGDPVTVLNPDPSAAIATGKRVGWMVDQSGTKIVSPLQC